MAYWKFLHTSKPKYINQQIDLLVHIYKENKQIN